MLQLSVNAERAVTVVKFRGKVSRLAGIHLLDYGSVLLHGLLTPQLQRRGKLPTFEGEFRHKTEVLHSLGVRLREAVGLRQSSLDVRLVHRASLRLVQRLRRRPLNAQRGTRQLRSRLARLAHLTLQGQHHRQVLPLVADHHRVGDAVECLLDLPFDQHRRDVLAARRDDKLLLPAGDAEVLVCVEVAEVARVQPATLVHRLRRLLLVVHVAHHHVAPPPAHLTFAELVLLENLDLVRRVDEDLAAGADPERVRRVQRLGSAALRHAVDLHHRDVERREELDSRTLGRRGTGVEPRAGVETQLHLDGLEHGLARQPVAPRHRLLLREGRRGAGADALRPVRHCALEARHGAARLAQRLLDLLPHPRHTEEDGGPRLLQAGDHLLHHRGRREVAAPAEHDLAEQVHHLRRDV
eukprot:Rhum_TRINITY_DN3613_c0_g1::Rhum_TRINITY_DN3613_c0_g1_i1::g.11540::m.11540